MIQGNVEFIDKTILNKKEGPEESAQEGKGFIVKDSLGGGRTASDSKRHDVEFRPGASNIEALKEEDIASENK